MSRTSWKTTVMGLGAALPQIADALNALTDKDPLTMPNWYVLLSTIFISMGLMAARDNNVTSEDVKARKANGGNLSSMGCWAIVLALCLPLWGCAGSGSDLSKAERRVGALHAAVASVRDVEHQLVVDAMARGDTETAQKAANIERAAAGALPYIALAKDALSAARGDPDAQARILQTLTTQIATAAHADPHIALAVAILPPLIAELINEAQNLPGPSPPGPVPPSAAGG